MQNRNVLFMILHFLHLPGDAKYEGDNNNNTRNMICNL